MTSDVKKLAKLRANLVTAYYGKPAKDMKIIAVTGENGREAVARYVYEIVRALDPKVGFVTVAVGRGITVAGLQRQLSRSWKDGANYVIVEAPIRAIERQAFYALPIHMVVVTDISGADQEYLAQHAALWATKPEFSVLNRDDVSYDYLAGLEAKNVFSFGRNRDASTWIGHTQLYKKGAETSLTYGGTTLDVATYLTGNEAPVWMAAAATAGLLLGADLEAVVDGIAEVEL